MLPIRCGLVYAVSRAEFGLVAEHAPVSRRPTPRRTLPHRDALTGAPLTPSTRCVLRMPASSRPAVHADHTGDAVISLPTRIDTHAPSPGGHLGGKRWSPEFARYIAPVLPLDIAERYLEQREWWRVPYGLDRVRQAFYARYGATRGEQGLQAALARLRNRQDYAVIAATFQRSPGWVKTHRDFAERIALRRYVEQNSA